jgi:hypothetical protein
MAELSMDEISVVSVQGRELYAYIGLVSAGKQWPDEMEHLGLRYELEDTWNLPAQMGNFIQAARYLLITL